LLLRDEKETLVPNAPKPFAGDWWHQLLLPDVSWTEKLLRPVMVYVALMVIFRIASKRELAQATLFDFLIILLISNVVQNAIIGNDNSVLGALAGAVTLVVLAGALNRVTARSKKARELLEGKPVLLVNHGGIDDETMKQQAVSRNDLLSAIRKQGIVRLSDVGYAILELDGTISVIKKDDDKTPPDCLPAELVGEESVETRDPVQRN
jgi:uncharacterized membrane protein YcaP (DUF421 family)